MAGFDASEIFELAADLKGSGAKVKQMAGVVVHKALIDIESDAKRIITEKDIVDTGNLRSSVSYLYDGKLSGEVGPDANYGIFHEIGTSTMPARPFMGPATDRNVPGFVQAMEQIVDGVI
ncbi:HK97-gp10 family putative phage morphogenesis protein [Arthrobacter cryoconiti]|uniref:HK97-gp10 family putative phage morphogenesis protein n=1 Tax=Arthrobacter cryoconiti TaxID=748907 RepID=A0ABV8QY08_9MICC|nr:HK97-gp10 family putative phage morphogenesis protein [Arthrobacter cryoconiti]MCC9068800.1 hypothetical protein [Arthrobacter cryoconiti]